MGRTYRTKKTVNECLTIRISDLTKKFNTLKGSVNIIHGIEWSSNGEKIGSIGYEVNTLDMESPYIRLYYQNTNHQTEKVTDIDYKIYLQQKETNLPNKKGFRWYFICPDTQKLCTLLVCQGKYFTSRDPKQVYYESQTLSKKERALEAGYFYKMDELDQINYQFDTGELTKYYNGKQTKRYQKFLKQYAKAERASNLVIFEMARFIEKHNLKD